VEANWLGAVSMSTTLLVRFVPLRQALGKIGWSLRLDQSESYQGVASS
jgi:hypothetical protein